MNGHDGSFNTRERVLAIAARLFAENGYHATGISALSAATRIGRGALYYHIGSKENLLFEISRIQIERLIRDAQAIIDSAESPQWKLRFLARGLMRNIANHGAEWTVFFHELPALTGPGRVEVLALRERYEEMWRDVLIAGAENGQFTSVDPVLVKGILGMFNYSYVWLDPTGSKSPEDVAELFTLTLLNGLSTGAVPARPLSCACATPSPQPR